GDAPVPVRAIRPDAAPPDLHGEGGAGIEHVAALAGAHLAVAWQRRVLRVALEARRRPRHDHVQALVPGRPAHREVGDDRRAAAGGAAEAHGEIVAVDAVLVLEAARLAADARLDLLGQREAARAPERDPAPLLAVAEVGQRERAEGGEV